jgi:hypothetical protein
VFPPQEMLSVKRKLKSWKAKLKLLKQQKRNLLFRAIRGNLRDRLRDLTNDE